MASTDKLWHLAFFGVSYLSPSLFPLGIELGGWAAQHKLFASAQKTPAESGRGFLSDRARGSVLWIS